MERITPNFSIQVPGGLHSLNLPVTDRFVFDEPILSKHAGGRQRNQLRRLDQYPLGNEPKPWSKRSREKKN